MPVTLVVGERDEKFRAHRRADGERLPNAQLVVVPGAGHAAQLEAPDAVARRDLPVRVALFVGLRVVVAVEVLFQELVERGAVAHDRVGGVLVAVFGVLDEIGFSELKAFAFALAGFDAVVRARDRPCRPASQAIPVPWREPYSGQPGAEGTGDRSARRFRRAGRVGEVLQRSRGRRSARSAGRRRRGRRRRSPAGRRRSRRGRRRRPPPAPRGASSSTPVIPPREIFRQTSSAAPEPGACGLVHRDRHRRLRPHGAQRVDAVDRLLAQLEPDRRQRAQVRERLLGRPQAPLASTRMPTSGPTAARTAASRPASSPMPTLTFTQRKPVARPRRRPRRRRRGRRRRSSR